MQCVGYLKLGAFIRTDSGTFRSDEASNFRSKSKKTRINKKGERCSSVGRASGSTRRSRFQNPSPFPFDKDVAQNGRASKFHLGGCGFESRHLCHFLWRCSSKWKSVCQQIRRLRVRLPSSPPVSKSLLKLSDLS